MLESCQNLSELLNVVLILTLDKAMVIFLSRPAPLSALSLGKCESLKLCRSVAHNS